MAKPSMGRRVLSRLAPVHRGKPGASPGVVHADPEAKRTKIHAILYGPDRLEEVDIDDVSRLATMKEPGATLWVNVDGLGDGEDIHKIGETFGLHPLAMEDVIHVHQRPKVDEFDDHLYVVLRMASMEERLQTEQVSIFLLEGVVITFQEWSGDCLDPVRERIRQGRKRIRSSGADYLAYALIDAIVDHYFPVIAAYGQRIEDLEDEVLESPVPGHRAQIHEVRRDLLLFRRAVWPLREALHGVLRGENDLFGIEVREYLRDAYDHSIQVVELLETSREVAVGLMDAYLSGIGQKTNEVMKVLTIIATIFIPITFIAGIYGMNFDGEVSPWNLPELRWAWGYPACIGVMVVTTIGFLIYFRRKGWLGGEA